MASGASVRTKVAKTLARLTATSRTVSFREIGVVGGNSLLGIGSTVVNADTVVDPQPAVETIQTHEIASSSGILQMGDYRIVFAGSVAEATLQTNMILYGDEVLKVISYVPFPLQGVIVAWEVVARAVKP